MLAVLMLLLLFDPSAVVSVSLWLSFAAVTALLIWAGREPPVQSDTWPRLAWQWVANLFWVSVVATLATLPIVADLFGRIPTYSLLANIMLVPLYALWVLPLSIIGEVFAVFGGASMASLIFSLAAAGVEQGNGVLAMLKTWPGGNLWVPDISLFAGIVYMLGFVIALGFLASHQIRSFVVTSMLTVGLYLGIAVPESGSDTDTLLVWDVGQGASSSMIMADGNVMIIDVPGRYGSRYNGGTDVAAGLREQGLVHVDLLILSHAQSDHAGGAARLLDQLRYVKELWLADIPVNRTYPVMRETVARISRSGGQVRWLQRGDRLKFAGAEVEVLWPPKDYESGNGNNTSLVLSMQLATGRRILFPADIEAMVEKKIVKQGLEPHDIMLVPHHGSLTSSTAAWLDRAAAKIAVVQTGRNNRYQFPRTEVVNRYRARGSQFWDTKHGMVTIRFADAAKDDVEIDQFGPESEGKRETALQWRQSTL